MSKSILKLENKFMFDLQKYILAGKSFGFAPISLISIDLILLFYYILVVIRIITMYLYLKIRYNIINHNIL